MRRPTLQSKKRGSFFDLARASVAPTSGLSPGKVFPPRKACLLSGPQTSSCGYINEIEPVVRPWGGSKPCAGLSADLRRMAAASLLAAGQHAFHTAWTRYCDHLVQRPLATKVLTGAGWRCESSAAARTELLARCCLHSKARAPVRPHPPPHLPPDSGPPIRPPGVVGTLIGDGIAQGAAHVVARRRAGDKPANRRPRFHYDVARAARLCAYAALIGTPVGHYWFAFLDKVAGWARGGGREVRGGRPLSTPPPPAALTNVSDVCCCESQGRFLLVCQWICLPPLCVSTSTPPPLQTHAPRPSSPTAWATP
jgi:hypothetical protein